jgi:hypothetical protein
MAKECRFRSAALFSSHLFGPRVNSVLSATAHLYSTLSVHLSASFSHFYLTLSYTPLHPRAATTLVSRGVQLAVSRDSRGTPGATRAHAPRDGPDGRSSVHDPGLDSARADRVTVP